MSKSKGNILDPIDLIDGIELDTLIEKRTTGLMQPQMATKIEKATRKHFPDGIEPYGTDALRFTFASLATQGRFINFETGRIQGYRNFCNKIWNATRYILMNIESHSIDINKGDKAFGLAERWVQSKLSESIAATHEGMKTYRFDLASQALYEFTWDEFCDWYLELSKTTLSDENAGEAEKRGTLFTLVSSVEILLRALHPFMPFITEELWARVSPLLDKDGKTIMQQTFPTKDELKVDHDSVKQVEWIKSFIMGVRRIRAERDIAPGKPLSVFTRGGNDNEKQWLDENQNYIRTMARIDSIESTEDELEDAVMSLAGDMSVLVPLADIIDPAEEKERLEKTISKLEKEKSGLENKLANNNFVERAPADVVDGAKQKLTETLNEIETYQVQLDRISKLVK